MKQPFGKSRGRWGTGLIALVAVMGMRFPDAHAQSSSRMWDSDLFNQTAESASLRDDRSFVEVLARDKFERTRIAELGVSIETVLSDRVWGFVSADDLARLQGSASVVSIHPIAAARGGHDTLFGEDFPNADSRYHNYQETVELLQQLAQANPDIAYLKSIGKSVEGRDIWALNISTRPGDQYTLFNIEWREPPMSRKPGTIFMGAHHAREHLSTEIPLMLAEHILKHRSDPAIERLIATRDIWIIPIVNPDGKEFDIAKGRYQMWRKNRRRNNASTFGVDLNRNYGFGFGGPGSSGNPSSDTYRGPEKFSEPETRAIRDFVTAHAGHIKTLLSFHTFSELVLYPFGHTYADVPNPDDLAAFQAMAKNMANMNGYTPQKSSELYLASGDTTDWAYGELGMFAFTFELAPRSMSDGGFYPGVNVIEETFSKNLAPSLYLIDLADNPRRATTQAPAPFLRNYVEPSVDPFRFWEPLGVPARRW